MEKIIYLKDDAGNEFEYLKMPVGKSFMEWCTKNYPDLLKEEVKGRDSISLYAFDEIKQLLSWVQEMLDREVVTLKQEEICRISRFTELVEAHNWLIEAKKAKKEYAMINIPTGEREAYTADNKVIKGVRRNIEFYVKD